MVEKQEQRLEGRVALITGGASGLGAEIARTLARQGAAIIIGDLNLEPAQIVADEILREGGRSIAVKMDVSSGESYSSAVQIAETKFSKLNVIVNNAGYTQRIEPMIDVNEETFDRLIAVNIKSIYWSVIYGVPAMKRTKGGVIVNIGSTGAARPRPNLGWYNATKGAVVTATKSLALELASLGIRVCAINPTTADTPMIDDLLAGRDAQREAMVASIPLGRFCAPLDVAHATAFLVSEEAQFLTGTCLDVDGGRAI